jgi:hypothetical protein
MHLDVVKFREVEIVYTQEQIEDWHSWAVAVARKILRDDVHEPILNDGCPWCPIRFDCPAFESVTQVAAEKMADLETFTDPAQRLAWRDEANRLRLLLEKAVKGVDEALETQVIVEGEVVVGDQRFVMEMQYENVIDVRRLHRAMGDEFYSVVSTSVTAVDRVTKGWSTEQIAPVNAAIERRPSKMKMVRRKVEG